MKMRFKVASNNILKFIPLINNFLKRPFFQYIDKGEKHDMTDTANKENLKKFENRGENKEQEILKIFASLHER